MLLESGGLGYGGSVAERKKARPRPLSMDCLLLPAIFISGLTFGLYFGHRSSASCPEAPPYDVEMLKAITKKDAECTLKINHAEKARDQSWESVMDLHRKEINQLKQEASRRLDSSIIAQRMEQRQKELSLDSGSSTPCPTLDQKELASAAAAQFKQETGIGALRVVEAEPLLTELFPYMVPTRPVAKMVFMSHNARDRFEVLGKPITREVVDKSCKQLSVVYTEKDTCTVVVPVVKERSVVPMVNFKFEKDPNGTKWKRYDHFSANHKKTPNIHNRARADALLMQLLPQTQDLVDKILPVLSHAAKPEGPKRVKVMALNQGNLPVFINFLCAVHQKGGGANVEDLVVFAADADLVEILKGLGINHVFYHKALGDFPRAEHKAYGDSTFLRMMWLKTVSAWLVNLAGYDLLYLDNDLIYMDPPTKDIYQLFDDKPDVDVFFQDDGSRSERFSPYFGNTGFYYLRHNPKTIQLMRRMLYSYDMVLAWQSHQSVMNTLLLDHYFRDTLTVMTLPSDLLPTGQVFHHKKGKLAEYLSGARKAYFFHMNWTLNNKEKVKYLQELGWWKVSPQCSTPDDITSKHFTSVLECCYNPPPPKLEAVDAALDAVAGAAEQHQEEEAVVSTK